MRSKSSSYYIFYCSDIYNMFANSYKFSKVYKIKSTNTKQQLGTLAEWWVDYIKFIYRR
jgi:hypothetical protein